jgi:hypothetical protein
MRYLKPHATAVLIILLSCCTKPANEMALELSATDLSRGEPLIAKVTNAPAGARFEWQFPYSAHVLEYSADSSKVKLTFSDLEVNSYDLCVKVHSGPDTGAITTFCNEIKTNAEKFEPPASLPDNSIKSLAGDRLTLQPVFYATDSTLNFIVHTANNYTCLNSCLLYSNASTNRNITISFNGLWLRDACEPVNMPAVSFVHTYSYYKDGNYPVQINFDNKVYNGSLTVSKYQGRYEFNWPYTDGVLIDPKVVE